MPLFARFQKTGTLTILSGVLPILGSLNTLQWEFIFRAGWLALAPDLDCAFLYWTKCPNVQKNVQFPDLLDLAQVSSSPPSVKGTRPNHEGTLAMAWLLLVARATAPAQSHLSSCTRGTFCDLYLSEGKYRLWHCSKPGGTQLRPFTRQRDVCMYNQIASSVKLKLGEGGWVGRENYLTQCIEKPICLFVRELL